MVACVLASPWVARSATFDLGTVVEPNVARSIDVPGNGISFNDRFNFSACCNVDVEFGIDPRPFGTTLVNARLELFTSSGELLSSTFSGSPTALSAFPRLDAGASYFAIATGLFRRNLEGSPAYRAFVFWKDDSISPVPLPPAAVLLGAGLGAFWLAGRRKTL
jgi:hypothetical protein